MRRLLAVLFLGLVGCGGVRFQSNFQPRNAVLTVSGFVTAIQFTTVVGQGTAVINVTLVTFEQSFSSSTVSFCGDLGGQFFLDAFTVVDFTQGPNCSTPLTINISG